MWTWPLRSSRGVLLHMHPPSEGKRVSTLGRSSSWFGVLLGVEMGEGGMMWGKHDWQPWREEATLMWPGTDFPSTAQLSSSGQWWQWGRKSPATNWKVATLCLFYVYLKPSLFSFRCQVKINSIFPGLQQQVILFVCFPFALVSPPPPEPAVFYCLLLIARVLLLHFR